MNEIYNYIDLKDDVYYIKCPSAINLSPRTGKFVVIPFEFPRKLGIASLAEEVIKKGCLFTPTVIRRGEHIKIYLYNPMGSFENEQNLTPYYNFFGRERDIIRIMPNEPFLILNILRDV